MRVILDYKVPVSVVVDVEEELVTRVVIHDDEIDKEPSEVSDENGRSIAGTSLATKAIEIADDASYWPSWQYV